MGAACTFAQATFPSTTLSRAVTATYSGPLAVASTTNILPPGLPVEINGVGDPEGATMYVLLVDTEAMCVYNVDKHNNVYVIRGCQGTQTQAHAAGAKVYTGPASYYSFNDPGGSCNPPAIRVLPHITLPSGNIWQCTGGVWVFQGQN